jgi:hypothetical protein
MTLIDFVLVLIDFTVQLFDILLIDLERYKGGNGNGRVPQNEGFRGEYELSLKQV